jgi:hypothetical protein
MPRITKAANTYNAWNYSTYLIHDSGASIKIAIKINTHGSTSTPNVTLVTDIRIFTKKHKRLNVNEKLRNAYIT